jgi:hypothetical protein
MRSWDIPQGGKTRKRPINRSTRANQPAVRSGKRVKLVKPNPKNQTKRGEKMNKVLALAITAVFSVTSFSVLAASHAGAQKDDKKMEKKADAKKADAKKDEKKEDKKK